MLDGAIKREPPGPAIVAGALEAAVADLTERFGADQAGWRWGRRHVARPAHPLQGASPELDRLLDVGSGPLSGDVDCVWATNSVPAVTDRALTGSTARYVWDLGDRSRSRWVVPLGASGHPASPHARDQQELWAQGELAAVEWEADVTEVVIEPVPR
jgi:penicillin amidase